MVRAWPAIDPRGNWGAVPAIAKAGGVMENGLLARNMLGVADVDGCLVVQLGVVGAGGSVVGFSSVARRCIGRWRSGRDPVIAAMRW